MMENSIQHPVVSIRIILFDEKGRILLLCRQNAEYGDGQWCLPGGKMDYNDTPENTVKKELFEETNLEVKDMCFLFYQNNPPLSPGKMHCLNLYFKCLFYGNLKINEESSDFAWVLPQDIGRYNPVFGAMEAIEIYLKKASHSSNTWK